MDDLNKVKREIAPAVRKNREKEQSNDTYTSMLSRLKKKKGYWMDMCFSLKQQWIFCI